MIKIKNLTYTYPRAEHPALKKITLSIHARECVGIIGKNGAGKSSLCYALAGLIPHFFYGTISGDLWLADMNVPDRELDEILPYVGIVLQNPANQLSGAKQTVREEIAFGLENRGVPRAEMLERIEWIATTLRIEHLLDRNPYHLSGGQMQRVVIAGVLALKPQLLILDEPTSQLDPQGTEDVYQALAALRQAGMTVVLVEHKMEKLAQFCDQLVVMADGEVKVYGTPDKVFANPKLSEWGVHTPLYTQAYQAVMARVNRDLSPVSVPVTLGETVERLKQYEQSRRM